ncbi:MAG: protease pro-enzyme activation domain-containing protein [Candidatus Binataceae bacterium]
MSIRGYLIWLSASALCIAIINAPIASAQTVQLHGTVSPDALKLPTFGDVPADTVMRLEIWFKPRDQAALNELLAAQQNPQSPEYRKWLSPQDYASRFGPADADFNEVSQWLIAQGFQVTGGAASESVIKFNGSVQTVYRAFNTRIVEFSPDGGKFSNVADPKIPAEFANVIGSITGLNNLARIVPLARTPIGVPTGK